MKAKGGCPLLRGEMVGLGVAGGIAGGLGYFSNTGAENAKMGAY